MNNYTVAQANIKRSKFDLSFDLLTTCNTGDLMPVLLQEVLPADTFKINTSCLVRMQTLIAPVFADIYFDTYYFFVPYRLVWEHWEEFLGANKTTAWTQTTEYVIPQVSAPSGGWIKGTIAQAFGCRIGVDNYSVNVLPFRAYTLIYNEWFRSENLQDASYFAVDDTDIAGSNGGNVLSDLVKGGQYAKVGKLRDMFTNALPAPQKGADVLLPIGDVAPVLFDNDVSNIVGNSTDNGVLRLAFQAPSGKWENSLNDRRNLIYNGTNDSNDHMGLSNQSLTQTQSAGVTIDNAYADLSQATAVTINSLRLAFQTQRLLERDARGGTRYNELIYSHFNTVCPDYRVQRPEYLGGSRHRLDISSVVQTSESGNTPQGTISAFSSTGMYNSDFSKSFTEFGMIIGLSAIRYRHMYAQGLPRLLSKKSRLDFYWPVLANIGEQPIKNKEIFVQGTSADDETFGYLEAWYEYRNNLNRVGGEMDPDYSLSLSQWSLVDNYSQLPVLSSSWLQEDQSIVDNVIAVQSSTSDQFKVSMHFDIKAVRPMPVHSVPGLIDHH